MPRKFLPEDVQALICEKYRAGNSTPALAEEFSVSSGYVLLILQRHGVARRGRSECHRTCQVNEAAFDAAELSPQAAYWVGLLMADGCCAQRGPGSHSGSPVVRLGLKASDLHHVEAFREFLGSTHSISITWNRDLRPQWVSANREAIASLAITSSRLFEALSRYGVGPRKSLTAQVLLLEDNSAFWRGLLDGDGWVSFTGRGNDYPHLGITGSLPMMRQFSAFVRRLCPECRATVAPNHSVWKVEAAGRHGASLARQLYIPGEPALPRKAVLACRAAAWRPRRRRTGLWKGRWPSTD